MTLAEFSLLVSATPKWVLNARAVLGESPPYSMEAAERLAIVRVLNHAFGIPLARAWELAKDAASSARVAAFPSADETAVLEVDVERIRAAIAVRASQAATMHQPRRSGRPPRRSVGSIRAAELYGIDIGLLRSNLARSPEARLRQLDAMASFRSRVRRRPKR